MQSDATARLSSVCKSTRAESSTGNRSPTHESSDRWLAQVTRSPTVWYAQGYAVRAEDLGTIDELATSFEASGYKFRELALNVATHETFSLVAPQPQ